MHHFNKNRIFVNILHQYTKMNIIQIEMLPFMFMDVFYTVSRTGKIVVISASINGLKIFLTIEQKESLKDEIEDILKFDFDNNNPEPDYFHDN